MNPFVKHLSDLGQTIVETFDFSFQIVCCSVSFCLLQIRRPLLARGHQAARRVATNLSISYPNSFSNIPSSCHQFPLTNQQLINQQVVNLLFAGLQFSHLGIGGLIDRCTVPPGAPIYHPPGVSSQLGVVLVRPWNSVEFQCLYSDLTNHQIGDPPKWPEWGPNRCLKPFKPAKNHKSEI